MFQPLTLSSRFPCAATSWSAPAEKLLAKRRRSTSRGSDGSVHDHSRHWPTRLTQGTRNSFSTPTMSYPTQAHGYVSENCLTDGQAEALIGAGCSPAGSLGMPVLRSAAQQKLSCKLFHRMMSSALSAHGVYGRTRKAA